MMKAIVCGVKNVKGVSTKSGSPVAFDICNVMLLQTVENMANEKVTVTGHGFEVAEMRLDPGCISQFVGLKFPAQVELETEPVPFRGRIEVKVVGLKKAA
jgi:hypothetical protein